MCCDIEDKVGAEAGPEEGTPFIRVGVRAGADGGGTPFEVEETDADFEFEDVGFSVAPLTG